MTVMEITPIIGCRVQCDFCPQPLLMNNYEKTNNTEKITFGTPVMMSFETYKTCINKIPKHVDIVFSGFSEAWLHPEATKMLLYAYERGHKVVVFTTLVGMKENDIDSFKHIPFTKFVLHLPDKQMYAKIAVNSPFLKVLKKIVSSNIHNLICMTMGDLPERVIEVIGTDFAANLMNDRAGNNPIGEKTPKKYGPILCKAASKNGVNILDENVLLPNGDVSLCCMDYGINNIIGNLISSDYHSLFQTPAFKEILKKMSAQDSDIMCRNCSYAYESKKTKILVHDLRVIFRHSRIRYWVLRRVFPNKFPKNIVSP